MRPTDKTTATAGTFAKLKSQFGKLVHKRSDNGPVVIDFPGHDFPVHVHVLDGPGGPVLCVSCAVCETADWSSGLASILLADSSEMLVGHIVSRGEGIVVEQKLFGKVLNEDFAAIVFTIAHVAARLQRRLGEMGALTTPESVG